MLHPAFGVMGPEDLVFYSGEFCKSWESRAVGRRFHSEAQGKRSSSLSIAVGGILDDWCFSLHQDDANCSDTSTSSAFFAQVDYFRIARKPCLAQEYRVISFLLLRPNWIAGAHPKPRRLSHNPRTKLRRCGQTGAGRRVGDLQKESKERDDGAKGGRPY